MASSHLLPPLSMRKHIPDFILTHLGLFWSSPQTWFFGVQWRRPLYGFLHLSPSLSSPPTLPFFVLILKLCSLLILENDLGCLCSCCQNPWFLHLPGKEEPQWLPPPLPAGPLMTSFSLLPRRELSHNCFFSSLWAQFFPSERCLGIMSFFRILLLK